MRSPSNSFLLLVLLHFSKCAFALPEILVLDLATDPEISDVAKRRQQKLAACGFDATYKQKDSESVGEYLRKRKRPPGTLVFIESHGGMIDENGTLATSEEAASIHSGWKFHFLKDRTKRDAVLGESVLQTLRNDITGPQVWVDACYGGGCRYCSVSQMGLGMSCTEREKSYNHARPTDVLIELLCSSNKDCVTWREADTDHDGNLTPQELTIFMDKKLDIERAQSLKVHNVGRCAEKGGEELRAERVRCEGRQGKITETDYGYLYGVDCQERVTNLGNEQTRVGQAEIDYYLQRRLLEEGLIEEDLRFRNEASFEKILKLACPKWPSNCGSEEERIANHTFKREFNECKIVLRESSFLSCLWCEFSEMQTVRLNPSDKPESKQTPLVNSYTLKAPQCRLATDSPPRVEPSAPGVPLAH